jgi:chromosome segregation ATPase
MRRILDKKPVDKSAEKKKRDALIQSIGVEETTKMLLLEEIKNLQNELKTNAKEEDKAREQVEFWKNAARDAERVFKELEAKVVPLHSRVAEVETRIGKLIKDEVDIKQSFRKQQFDITNDLAKLRADFEAEERRLSYEIRLLEQQKASEESRLSILSRSSDIVAEDIARKEREQQAIDSSLAHRMRELATINMNLAQTKSEAERAKKELDKVDEKLATLKGELMEKDKEIARKIGEVNEQEQQVHVRREQLVALAAKEKRIQEVIPAIEALYNRAGLKIKI